MREDTAWQHVLLRAAVRVAKGLSYPRKGVRSPPKVCSLHHHLQLISGDFTLSVAQAQNLGVTLDPFLSYPLANDASSAFNIHQNLATSHHLHYCHTDLSLDYCNSLLVTILPSLLSSVFSHWTDPSKM